MHTQQQSALSETISQNSSSAILIMIKTYPILGFWVERLGFPAYKTTLPA
jgi:hypothetical protein